MNCQLTEAILKSGLPSTDKLVCSALALFAGDDWEVYPSIATIRKVTDFSDRTIQRSLRRLCEREILLQLSAGGIAGSTLTSHYLLDPFKLPTDKDGKPVWVIPSHTPRHSDTPPVTESPTPRHRVTLPVAESPTPRHSDTPVTVADNILRSIWPKGLAPILALLADPGDPGYPDREDPGMTPSAVLSHTALLIAPDTAHTPDLLSAVQVQSPLVTQAPTVPVQPVLGISSDHDRTEPIYSLTHRVLPVAATTPIDPSRVIPLPDYVPAGTGYIEWGRIHHDLRLLGLSVDMVDMLVRAYLNTPGTSLAMLAAHATELRQLGPEVATYHGRCTALCRRLERGYPHPVAPAILAEERELYRIKPQPPIGRRIAAERV